MRVSVILVLLLAVCLALPGIAARTPLDRAMDSVVKVLGSIDVVHVPDGSILGVSWTGSGWVSSCTWETWGAWKLRIRTAGHVVSADGLPELVKTFLGWEPKDIKFCNLRLAVSFRDGTTIRAYHYKREREDSASLWLSSPTSRPSLPEGDPALVQVGDRLVAMGYPGGIGCTAFEGQRASPADRLPVDQVPTDWWFVSAFVGSGMSGGPVLNADYAVVAIVVATWSNGDFAISLVQPIR